MVTGIRYHEVFGGLSDGWPDPDALATQHVEAVVRGLAVPPSGLHHKLVAGRPIGGRSEGEPRDPGRG